MFDVRLALPAAGDIESLLNYSESEFGREARERYERLISTALELIANSPSVSTRRDEVYPGLHSFHLGLARRKARRLGPTVGRPRHLLVWRFANRNRIEVLRVLHDAMDLAQHLPPAGEK